MTNHDTFDAWWNTGHEHSRCWWDWEAGSWVCCPPTTAQPTRGQRTASPDPQEQR